jgi:3-oxoacyl-[acyl-carrier-protein] synthase II
MRRVVITGIGVISPFGTGAKVFRESLLAGKVALKRIGRFDPSGLPTQIAGEVPEYRIGDFVPKSYRKATKVMARDIELAVVAADDAMRDAGLQTKAYSDAPTIKPERFGCNIGAGLVNTELTELTAALHVAREGDSLDLHKWGRDGMNHLTPLWLLKYLPNMLACHVTIIHDLKGPSNTITCGDASGHLAIGEALRTIQRGDADMAICGGAESRVNPMGMMRHILLGRLCTSGNGSPECAMRPFDADARGAVLGEGGGLLILEEFESARSRGAKIYAEVVGFGASQDAYQITKPDPTGHSYARAIMSALAEAKASADQVDLLVPCGIGIPDNDRAELAGLDRAFGDALGRIPMALPKAQTGALAAAGGIEVVAAALAVQGGTIPPAVNTLKPLDGRTLNVSRQSRSAKVDIAVSSVYSIGGQNAALVLKKV